MFRRMLLPLSLTGLFIAGTCAAHAHLQSSIPADNAQLASAPQTLTLEFDETAQLAALKLSGGGKDIAVAVDKSAKPGRSMSLRLPALAPGKYTVHWTAIASDDGHITKGSFGFSILG